MRALTATLAAAARARDAAPYVRLRIADTPLEVPRLELTELYSEPAGDCLHDAAEARDGSIIRARINAGNLEVQRVDDPSAALQWSTWTDLGPVAAVQPAIGADGESDTVWLYAATDAHAIKGRLSSDDGATWGAWETVHDVGAGNLLLGLAADGRYGYAHEVFAGCNPGGGLGDDNYLAVARRAAPGVWSWQETNHDRYPIDGIGVGRDAAGWSYLVIADGNPPRISFQEYDGANWQGGAVIVEASDGSPYDYAHPRLVHSRADPSLPSGQALDRHVLTYVERCSSPAVSRAMVCFTPIRWWLTEVVPWDHATTYGVVVVKTAGYWYVIQSDRVHRAPVYTGATGQLLDVSQEEIAAVDAMERDGQPGSLEIALDNSSGKYSSVGVVGAYRCVREGSQVALGLGYHTSSGDEYVWTSPWWINRVSFVDDSARAEAYLILHCVDTLAWLRRLPARAQLQWTGASLGAILQRIWWRVCGRAEGSPHGNLATVVPYFSIQPGDSFGDAAVRVCRASGVDLRFRTYSTCASGVGWSSVEPEVIDHATAASAYSYGPASHPIRRGEWTAGGHRPGHAEVYGATHYGVWQNWDYIQAQWRDVADKIVDRKLDTQAKVDDRATYEGRYIQASPDLGEIEANVNPGLQVGDVVDVTDARAGLAAALRRVSAIRTTYERRRRGHYRQTIALGGTG